MPSMRYNRELTSLQGYVTLMAYTDFQPVDGSDQGAIRA